jgi:hypothetical protein
MDRDESSRKLILTDDLSHQKDMRLSFKFSNLIKDLVNEVYLPKKTETSLITCVPHVHKDGVIYLDVLC